MQAGFLGQCHPAGGSCNSHRQLIMLGALPLRIGGKDLLFSLLAAFIRNLPNMRPARLAASVKILYACSGSESYTRLKAADYNSPWNWFWISYPDLIATRIILLLISVCVTRGDTLAHYNDLRGALFFTMVCNKNLVPDVRRRMQRRQFLTEARLCYYNLMWPEIWGDYCTRLAKIGCQAADGI